MSRNRGNLQPTELGLVWRSPWTLSFLGRHGRVDELWCAVRWNCGDLVADCPKTLLPTHREDHAEATKKKRRMEKYAAEWLAHLCG